MPNMLWQGHQDAPECSSLTALLAGMELPAGAPAELQPVADALAALRAGPASDELHGEAVALAAFRDQVTVPDASQRRDRQPGRRRRPAFSPLLSARAAAAAVAAALCIGGVATAAYTGTLPAPVQQLAHAAFGAPPAAGGTHTGAHSGTIQASPGAASHAALGLCTAWAHARAHGSAGQRAAAFRNLAAAAGGAAKVAAYCATVAHRGTSLSPGPPAMRTPATHPTPNGQGKPTTHPTPHGPPTHGPTTHPIPHASGRPTTHP
jgi:hypothetical protein